MNLLYCAPTDYRKQQTPDDFGYLGLHIQEYENIVFPAFETLVKAIQNLPIHLMVKPHNIEGYRFWELHVKSFKQSNKITILKTRKEISDYFQDCDAMVLSYVSTTLIEAGIFKVPVFYIDLEGFNSKTILELESRGLLKVVHNLTELRQGLIQLVLRRCVIVKTCQ